MVEAYLFFNEAIREFFLGTDEESALAADTPLAARIEECFLALKDALRIVEIDLENPSGLLCEGMYGRATIELRPPSKGLSLPAGCVIGHRFRLILFAA